MQNFSDILLSYFEENNFLGINIYYYDAEKIILNDIKIDKKLIIRNDTFKKYIGRGFEECAKAISYSNFRNVGNYLKEYSRLKGYLTDNEKLETFYEYGFYHHNYAEFIIVNRDYHLDIEGLNDFFINNQKINQKIAIGQPSDMLRMILKSIEEKSDFDWCSYKTIKFYNIKKEDVNNYLQEVLFLLEFYKPWFFQLGCKSTYMNLYSNTLLKKIKPCISNSFVSTEFIEPIYFYNEAMKRYYINIEDEIAFLYFYKVIEYFFLINRKNEISDIIKENLNDINKLILKMNEIYKTDEKSCLNFIVKNKRIEPKIYKLIYAAYKEKLITKRSSGEFVKGVYKFRNSIAHGKGGSNYTLKMTNALKQDIEIIRWNNLMQNFASICINEFCYDGKL